MRRKLGWRKKKRVSEKKRDTWGQKPDNHQPDMRRCESRAYRRKERENSPRQNINEEKQIQL